MWEYIFLAYVIDADIYMITLAHDKFQDGYFFNDLKIQSFIDIPNWRHCLVAVSNTSPDSYMWFIESINQSRPFTYTWQSRQ